MTILQKIILNKRKEISQAKALQPPELVKQEAMQMSAVNRRLLKADHIQLIAEVKAKSPSKGAIRLEFNPVKLARSFEIKGASAISVLTDEKYFGGNLKFIEIIRQKIGLPILRKDFIVNEYQVYETKAVGADIILLIVRVAGQLLESLLSLSLSLGLQVLVEVHNPSELRYALSVLPNDPAVLIGVNNRDLHTFSTSIKTSLELASLIPDNFFKVSESGVESEAQVDLLWKAGFNGVLIGEGLAKNENIFRYFKNHETR